MCAGSVILINAKMLNKPQKCLSLFSFIFCMPIKIGFYDNSGNILEFSDPRRSSLHSPQRGLAVQDQLVLSVRRKLSGHSQPSVPPNSI